MESIFMRKRRIRNEALWRTEIMHGQRDFCWLAKQVQNKKHSAPSAHQNTALNSHASSCQKERSVTKKSRITTRQTGAASIAPISGRSTRCPGERQLAAAPGSKKNSSPSSG